MANDILRYTSKDFESIKADLIDAISAISGTWTSRDDGDPGIVLVKLMSALGDMLSFNADKQALEYYAPTVTQRKNAARLFALIGYYMHWYKSAKTTLTLTNRAPMPDYVEEYYLDLYFMYKNSSDKSSYDNSYESLTPEQKTEIGEKRLAYVEEYQFLDPNDNKYKVMFPDLHDAIEVDNLTNKNFYRYCNEAYDLWVSNNLVNISTYIYDKNRTLGVYSTGAQSIVYTLLPTTETPQTDKSGNYLPNIVLKPYEPMKVEAYQGYLCETTFNSSQLRNNRYYVPDIMLDEKNMWCCYISKDDTEDVDKPIFLKKTDNLLTINDSDELAKNTIYFQFGVDEFDFPYIEIASYWQAVVGKDSPITFKLYYIKTLGKYGNISTNYLNSIETNSNIEVSVENVLTTDAIVSDDGDGYLSEPGLDPENAEEAYKNSINYIMTYDTLVTIYDFSRFLKRQLCVSNGFACDIQHKKDLNNEIDETCLAYTDDQLRSILGNAANGLSHGDLVKCLQNIRHVTYDYRNACVTKSDALLPITDDFLNYKLNLYPIMYDYYISDLGKYEYDEDNPRYAEWLTKITRSGSEIETPYKLYKVIYDENKIDKFIDEEVRKTRIVNIEPSYAPCRVFDWRCCGTIHLTQSVSKNEANNIIKSVISLLQKVYAPQNVEFGKKITYMEVIDTIMSADSRIRYFDAGIGDKKLIDFEIPDCVINYPNDYFNVEAYFNPESIMRYVQEYDENNGNGDYCNMICVDPIYIQKDS
jgi:hypothetical protein